jgi:long-subunit fatty acid transport protein
MTITTKQIIIALTFAVLLFPIDVFSQAGGASVPFLRISPDARSSGMGEAGVAVADDANAVYWNPAGLGFLDYFNKGSEFEDPIPFKQIAISYSP